jgi:RNA polymerase sigma-70 factor (ECF subfamily)
MIQTSIENHRKRARPSSAKQVEVDMDRDTTSKSLSHGCSLSAVKVRSESSAFSQRPISSFQSEMIAAMPRLRSFAISLSKDRDRAEDLVQETFVRALTFEDRFESRGEILPWLKTILRNQFYSEQHKRRREIADADGKYAETLVTKAEQQIRVEYSRVFAELSKLPRTMRDALLLVGRDGLSYDEASLAENCPKGTMKTRVHRARTRLTETLGLGDVCSEFTDTIVSSVLTNAERSRSDLGQHYN